MSISALGSSEVIQIVDSLAKDLGIGRDSVLKVLENSIEIAARKKYGNEFSIRATVNRRNGEISLYRDMIVVSAMDDEISADLNHLNRVLLEDAKHKHPECNIGDVVSDDLPPIDLARVAAQTAKQVMSSGLKEVIAQKEYEEFIARKHEIVSGIVDKIERGNLIIKLGGTEAILPRSEQLRSDRLKQGDRVRALLLEVERDNKHTTLILSRSHNLFVAKLFEQEVPEVFEKAIEVKAVARDPGSRAKVAVYTRDSTIDAVGSCVGIRGARVMSVTNELNGEKIDVIEWSIDPANMVINALSTAEVMKVIIDEDNKNIEVVVPESQLSIAIGRKGQNIRLASQLIGWSIKILSEDDESKRRVQEFNVATQKFIDCLDLEEILAQLLVSEGYSSIKEIASANATNLGAIEGLDVEIAEELTSRAKEYLENNKEEEYKPKVIEIESSKEVDSEAEGSKDTDLASENAKENEKKESDEGKQLVNEAENKKKGVSEAKSEESAELKDNRGEE